MNTTHLLVWETTESLEFSTLHRLLWANQTNESHSYWKNIDLSGEVRIPPYVAIFLLAVCGNSLIIITLIQNKRMRTVTNVFLLNLAISDLLLAVFCMPFTLIPVLLRNFIFGATMCVMIRYLQGVSVAVSCFTLVAISLERYFAICRPLHSRRWQTLSHAYKTIAACWFLASVVVIPIAIFTKLLPFRNGVYMCRERWDSKALEKAYTVFLDWVFLLVPVAIMAASYGSIVRTLWMGIQMDMKSQNETQKSEGRPETLRMTVLKETSRINDTTTNGSCSGGGSKARRRYDYQTGMRKSNIEKSVAAKKRVIKMLSIVVLEFFVCWTPLFVVQTWMVFDRRSTHQHVSPVGLSFIHLLSYVSSCCNPITYCFMNRKFRQAFFSVFRCCSICRKADSRRDSTFSGHSASIKTNSTHAPMYDKMEDYNKIEDSEDVSE